MNADRPISADAKADAVASGAADAVTVAKAAAFVAATRQNGDDAAALLALHPSGEMYAARAADGPVPALRDQLTHELTALEDALRPMPVVAVAGVADDLQFYIRRRRLDVLCRRTAALRTLPARWRRVANWSAEDCARVLDEIGVEALARGMKSVRPEELPAALQRLDAETGRRVLQRVLAGPADWPSTLRRLVRTRYFALVAAAPAGRATLQAIGRSVLAVEYAQLADAERQTLSSLALCDVCAAMADADADWLSFAEHVRPLARGAMVARVGRSETERS